MNTSAENSIKQLRGPVLRSVSRSFYLSIRLLPKNLRDPIALAYLLARATDTIADTAEISAAVRMEHLGKLAAGIQRSPLADTPDSSASFAALQKQKAERALIDSLTTCFAWLEAMPAADCADIREVLAKINQGQTLDVQRFANSTRVSALATTADLECYTYLVAGCVGEFWTKVCLRHLANFSERPREEMLSLGKDYGKGLQLVNILRDLGADLGAGRCYLPFDELDSLGMRPEELLTKPQSAEPIMRAWRERAQQGMAAGVEYGCAIQPWRVRLATALPALLGARTLALLRTAGPRAVTERIKVPRSEMRQLLWQSVRTLAAPRTLRAVFARLSA